MPLLLALVLLALLVPPAGAHAPGRLAEMQAVAVAAYPTDACTEVVVLTDHEHLPPAPSPSSIGWASSWYGHCRISLAATVHRLPVRQQCKLVVHEYGHLAGQAHRQGTRSIMNPTPTVVRYPACRRVGS